MGEHVKKKNRKQIYEKAENEGTTALAIMGKLRSSFSRSGFRAQATTTTRKRQTMGAHGARSLLPPHMAERFVFERARTAEGLWTAYVQSGAVFGVLLDWRRTINEEASLACAS